MADEWDGGLSAAQLRKHVIDCEVNTTAETGQDVPVNDLTSMVVKKKKKAPAVAVPSYDCANRCMKNVVRRTCVARCIRQQCTAEFLLINEEGKFCPKGKASERKTECVAIEDVGGGEAFNGLRPAHEANAKLTVHPRRR